MRIRYRFPGKMYFAVLLLISIVTKYTIAEEGTGWNYTDIEAWKHEKDWFCDGTRQSPININTTHLKEDPRLMDLTLNNFDRRFNGKVNNNGHTVLFFPDTDSSTATFVNHVGTYNFKQFHFHWGRSAQHLGSEHAVDGSKFSGELHFVTTKSTENATAGDAAAVLGILLMEDPSASYMNTIWMELVNSIPHEAMTSETVVGVVLSYFIPDNLSYYHYEGSLTTPPCSQVVQWFLLKNPLRVPTEFMDVLRTMVNDDEGETLTMNFRDTQQLYNRDVFEYDVDDDDTSATSGLTSFGVTLLAVTAVLACGNSH